MNAALKVVVASTLEREAAASVRAVEQAPAGCGLVELRADHLRADELAGAVGRSSRPLIVTVRRVEKGGGFDGSEDERREMLLAALDAGARYIDVEAGSAVADLAQGSRAGQVILSHHDAACRVEELRGRFREMASSRAALLKLVPTATSLADAGAVREFLQSEATTGRLACFAQGRLGAVTRLLAPRWGSWATYGAAQRERPTAEGQFSAQEMLELHDVLNIGAATRSFALVGSKVFGSPSPAMHRAGYVEAGIDARYFPIELDRWDELPPLVGAEGVLGLEALAVTMPFKERAARRCRLGDPDARASRAVNTVRIAADGWCGFNTDGAAALGWARGELDPAGARVAIVGAGGTARALAAAFGRASSAVTLFNRTVARAEAAACELGAAARPLDQLERAEWDLLVNATPRGRAGETLLPPQALGGRAVIDAVYGPRPTPLVAAARKRGLAVLDGFGLLVGQALLQFEIMTGRVVQAETLRRAGRAWLDV